MARSARRTDRLLAALPEPRLRSAEQRAAATEAKEAVRSQCSRFLDSHVDAVYDELTSGRTTYMRLGELAEAAAAAFPGLVPSSDQLAAERLRPQAGKEGHEISQGIFFSRVLRSPLAGPDPA